MSSASSSLSVTLPRIKHLLVLLRFVSGPTIAELRVTKPRTGRYVQDRRCSVADIGCNDSDVIGRHLGELRLRWNDENRFGARCRLKQPTLNLLRRKPRQRSPALRGRHSNLPNDVLLQRVVDGENAWSLEVHSGGLDQISLRGLTDT